MLALLTIVGFTAFAVLVALIVGWSFKVTQAIDDAFNGFGNVNETPSHSEGDTL
jgi:hypothetical protein